jgi:hypothetical protein
MATSQFPAKSTGVRWRTVASGSSSTETQQKLVLAGQLPDLQNLWQPVLKQSQAIPLVDFTKDRLAIVFLGTRNSGGYSAQVSSVLGQGGTSALLLVNEITPNPKMAQTQAITSPWVMIAIDRGYLDLSVKFQKVVDSTNPNTIQLNPLTSVTFLPWNPCGYGYGGGWTDPYCYGFDNPYEYGNWCNQNNITPFNLGGLDFTLNRLVFISAGDYGLGYGIQIGDVLVNAGETVVQVRRNGTQVQSTQRSFVLISMSRQTKKVNVEYLVNSQECYVDSGILLPVKQAGSWVFQSRRELDAVVDMQKEYSSTKAIDKFDYKNQNLGVIVVPEQRADVRVTVDRIAYRGSVAYVYMKRTKSGGLMNGNVPYFALKLDKKVRSIKVVEM